MTRRRPKARAGLRFHRATEWSGSSTWGTVTRWVAELDGERLGAWDRGSPLPLAEWRAGMLTTAAVVLAREAHEDLAFRLGVPKAEAQAAVEFAMLHAVRRIMGAEGPTPKVPVDKSTR